MLAWLDAGLTRFLGVQVLAPVSLLDFCITRVTMEKNVQKFIPLPIADALSNVEGVELVYG